MIYVLLKNSELPIWGRGYFF